MSFARSLLVFVTVAAAICFPLFFGYGLSEGSFMWMGLGFGFLVFAGALAYLQTRGAREHDARASRHGAHP